MLGRQVTMGKVRMNPYTLSVTIEQFDIRSQDGASSFLGWNRLYVNFDLLSSLTGDWVLSDIELDGFHAAPEINADGSLNFADVIKRGDALASPPAKPGTAPAKPARPIRIGRMQVNGARVDFADHSRPTPFKTVVGPVSFVLTSFRTAGAVGAPYHFEAVTEAGEKFAWTGTLAADPVESRGKFAVENLVLKKYSPYFVDRVRADLADGQLTVRGSYEVLFTAKQRTMKLTDGEVHLRALRMHERGAGQPAVELPAVDVTGITADAIAMKATVDRVAVAGGHIVVRREADGSLNLLTMLTPAPVASPAQPAVAPATPAPAALPDFKIGEVAVQDFKVDVTDNAAPRPAQLTLTGLHFSLKNATLASGAVMPMDVSFTWAPQGTVHAAGTIALKPELTADLKAEVADFSILPLSPYLEEFANVRITQGTVTTTNSVRVALPEGGAPVASFAGDITMDKFGLVDGIHNEDLLGFAALALKDLKLEIGPQISVSLAELNLAHPYARARIDKDKSVNVIAILLGSRYSLVKSGQPPAAGTPAAPPKVEVGKVVITDGDMTFADSSLEPNVHIAITQFGGTITGLSSSNPARADVDLKGVIDGTGQMAISGKLDPLGANR